MNLPIGLAALAGIASSPQPAVRHTARRARIAGATIVTATTTAALLVTVWGGTVVGLIAYLLAERRAVQSISPLHCSAAPCSPLTAP